MHHRGHLIAKEFGGSNKVENIVAMYKGVNKSAIRPYEIDVSARLHRGETVYYSVVPVYNLQTGTVPKGLYLNMSSESGIRTAYIPNLP